MNGASRHAPRRREARWTCVIAVAVSSAVPPMLGCDVLLGITDVPVPQTDGATSVHPAGPTDGSADTDSQASSSPGACDTQNDSHKLWSLRARLPRRGVFGGRVPGRCASGHRCGRLAQRPRTGRLLPLLDGLVEGTVNRTSKSTGATMLAYRDPAPIGIAVDDAGIYWGDFQGLWRCAEGRVQPIGNPNARRNTRRWESSASRSTIKASTGPRSQGESSRHRKTARMRAAPRFGKAALRSITLRPTASASTSRRRRDAPYSGRRRRAADRHRTAGPSSSEGVALTDGVVYWTVFDPSNGQVNAASTTSLSPTTFVGTLELPLAVASDGINVYWADMPSEGPPTAEIHQVRGGGVLPHRDRTRLPPARDRRRRCRCVLDRYAIDYWTLWQPLEDC